MKKIRVFLDATVLISAIMSDKGASRELFHLAKSGFVELVTNENAIIETERNLQEKAPEVLPLFNFFTTTSFLTIHNRATSQEVAEAVKYTVLKDAPIVAGAIATKSDYLATFDRKHLINPPEVSEKSGVFIATSGDILEIIRDSQSQN